MRTADLIDRFLRHCRRNDCRPNTLRQYTARLRPLLDTHGEAPWPIPREDLLDLLYQANHWPADHPQAGEPKSTATIRANLTAVQLLQEYAAEFHALERPLSPRDLKKPATGRRERFPTAEETRRLLEIAPPDWALLYRALRLTGARPSELIGAQIADLDDHPPAIVIARHKTSRKTGKPRRIPIGDTVAPLIAAALAGRTEGPLFLDAQGRPWNVPRVSRIFRRLRRKLGLSESLVLYSARHEFGSAVARQFGILQAKELLGHTDIATTQRYSHLTEDQLRTYQADALADVETAADAPPTNAAGDVPHE